MNSIISTGSNCRNCYKCIRQCPVKAIKYADQSTIINQDLCIACGKCITICPKNTKRVVRQWRKIYEMIQQPQPVIAVVKPSFASIFSQEEIIGGLRNLGFSGVYETALGGEQVVCEYGKYLDKENPIYAITTHCPAMNHFIERYYPDLTPYLLPFITAASATCQWLKKNMDCRTVIIGSCASMKYELDQSDSIDAFLTYEELHQVIKSQKFSLLRTSLDFDKKSGGRQGELFLPGKITGYLKETLEKNRYNLLIVEGIKQAQQLFQSMQSGELHKSFIEIFSCIGGCVNGPCIPMEAKSFYVRRQRMDQFLFQKEKPDELDWSMVQFETTFVPNPIPYQSPTEEELQKILKKMGKHTKRDELNCSACGYDSCRQKALSVFQGMSDIEMCMPNMRKMAEDFSDVIFYNSPNCIMILDENLHVLRLNPTGQSLFDVSFSSMRHTPVSQMIPDQLFKQVLETKEDIYNQRVVYPERDIITMQSITYIQDSDKLLVIIINITDQEKQKKELEKLKTNTMNITQNVINKQMRVAQEIASLLGETTAETKVALNELKQIMLRGD